MTLVNLLQPKVVAIVPAAGIGSRMLLDFPKQYIKINNRTVIEYTLTTLLSHPNIVRIIVSLHKRDNYFHRLSISSDRRIISVIGGEQRMYSVLSALTVDTDADWVIVHDAVRPCLSYQDLENLISITKKSSIGGILVKPVSDTMKFSNVEKEKILCTINRKNLWHSLTPQLFSLHLLRFCMKKIMKDNISITDESSALEYCGYNPLLVIGSRKNIKITWPEDIMFAEFYLNNFFSTK